MINNISKLIKGARYFLKGFQIYRLKGFRRYIYIPLLVNFIIFSISFYYGFNFLKRKIVYLLDWQLPSIFQFLQSTYHFLMSILKYPIIIILGVTLFIIIGFISSSLSNLIASPFNAFLVEKLDFNKSGFSNSSSSLTNLIKDSSKRELKKLCYSTPRYSLLMSILITSYWIPFINIFVSIAFSLYTAWMLTFEYLDYPADNRKVSIMEFRKFLKNNIFLCYGFGLTCLIFISIPVINLFIIPVAVTGATYIWIDELSHQSDIISSHSAQKIKNP